MKKQDGRIIMDKIKFVTDEGETVEFYVESEETDPEADYVMVEDDVELEAMSKVFSQMMDDVDIEM